MGWFLLGVVVCVCGVVVLDVLWGVSAAVDLLRCCLLLGLRCMELVCSGRCVGLMGARGCMPR